MHIQKQYRPARPSSLSWRVALSMLVVMAFVGLFGPWLWPSLGAPPAGQLNLNAINVPPLSVVIDKHDNWMYWLGTDALGRDVLGSLIYGTRTAMVLSFSSIGIALVLGLLLGMMSGYYGDDRWRIRPSAWLYGFIGLVGVVLLLFAHGQMRRFYEIGGLLNIGVVLIFILWTGLIYFISQRWSFGAPVRLAADSLAMRFLDLWKGLPTLVILLVFLLVVQPDGLTGMIGLIALLSVPNFSRIARAETLRHRDKPSLHQAIQSGRSDLWIWRHSILPHIWRPLIILAAFRIASVVLLEATLSFLGIGLPVDHHSWGALIYEARVAPHAWWLIVYPGLAMLALVWSLQRIGRYWEGRSQYRQQLMGYM